MGTWGTGPFDSDLAADFVDELEGLSSGQIIDALNGALQRVADSGTRVDGGDGVEAVAAAALVAAQVPGSGIVIDPDDGPKEALLVRMARKRGRPRRGGSSPCWDTLTGVRCRDHSISQRPPIHG
ncbi:DUF4259 domain-containing protein [Streptomyces sp. NBC_01390]|uniref:DUF4259 domain-containing protein n=1 Tax=Streptomyces sp. NBC_01390 TaxID=2903850 RepID=UPI003867DDDD